MAKNKTQTDTCLQCEGDKMLEVRKHASEAFDIMEMLIHAYGPNHKSASIVDYVRVLIEAEKDQRRLVAMLHVDARRRTKEVNDLICALKFVSDTTKEAYSSGANLSSKSMTISLTEIFRVAIQRLESIVVADKGLLDGKQPQNAKDFTAELRSPSPF
jgi:hypothetical protein